MALMLEILIPRVPELVSVTDWEALLVPIDWLVKVSAEADSVAAGAPSPTPSRGTVCTLPVAPLLLSVTVRAP